MSDWVRVTSISEFPPGARRVLEVDGVQVAVFNVAGAIHAIEDVCTHDGGELGSGELDGEEIVCPRHGARFDLKSGAVTAPPAYEAVAVLPTRIAEGWIEVRDERWD